MFKKEVERLVILGVLEVENYSEWGSPSFPQPKPKSNNVRFLSDFRNLNKHLKQKPHLIPKINEMLLKLECFKYAMSLYLNVEYYNTRFIKNTSILCMTILRRRKYCYKRLRMGVANTPDIFQQKMNEFISLIRMYLCVHI